MTRHDGQGLPKRLAAWCADHLFVPLTLLATTVYLLTLDRSASWWDCGEFIATGWTLGVGHPPGAPVYQLLSHLFMLLSFGHPLWVAPLSNAFSALCGGLTVGLLGLTLRAMGCRPFGAALGALCYLFCDTAWFSAVESEVYAPAMLCCALEVWLALRYRRGGDARLLLLLALLAGLGVGVHQMTLLALPATLLALLPDEGADSQPEAKGIRPRAAALGRGLRTLGGRLRRLWLPVLLLFLLGLTPYLIVPLRAAAHPAINEGDPSTAERFERYLRREQYAKAPLYPRMWRERDSANWREWTLGTEGVLAEAVYYGGYQLGFMYGRFLMYNFIGRENQKSHRIVVFVLPLLLGIWGLWQQCRRRRRDWWIVMLLFLFGGVLLNLYLNHPCYEPRLRDYAYILSFYAFALWIGVGASALPRRWWRWLALLAPLAMAVGNWSDHDRHDCHSVHDIAQNHLESCASDAILIALGDNDTFPLWYLQQVEERRTDVEVYNVGLTGWAEVQRLIATAGERPVYFTQYFVDKYAFLYPGRLRCEGFCWRLLADGDSDLRPRVPDAIEWHITRREYLPGVSQRFLESWEQHTGRPVPLR